MNTKKIISGVLMVVIAFSFLAAVPAANAQVTELWGKRYNGGHDDLPWSVAVDSEDNVIVTGWSDDGTACGYNYYTVKYDKNGIEQWSKTYDFCADYDMAFDVAVDSEDNVIVTGISLSGTYDYYTIKYDKNGNELWSRRYDGGHGWPSADMAFEVAVDSEDSVIVAGWTHDGTHYNYYTVKYDKNGVEQWNKTYDGGLDDLLFELAIDSEDSVIVTGYSDTAAAKYDYYTVKYDKNGVEQWSKRYDNSGFEDLAFYVATDSEDNVIVTGWSNDSTDYNYYTVKYDKNGVEIWNRTYDSLSEDLAWCVAVDSGDNVIVTGYSHDGSSFNYYTIKYDKNGVEQWSKGYDGGHDDVNPVTVVDSGNNVIVTGMSHNGTAYNYYTIEYDKNGNEIWNKSYDGGHDDVNPATAVDSENNVIVTGWSHAGAYYDYYTIKYEVPTPPPEPTIEVNKTVFNEATSQWVNETTAYVNDIVRFRIWVHNSYENVTCNLTNLIVKDVLSDSLNYSDNAMVQYPNGTIISMEPAVVGSEYQWSFPSLEIKYCDNITIEFDAEVVKEGNDINTVNVTGNFCGEIVSAEDTAGVTAAGVFDTGSPANPYPSIFGTHIGTITPNQTITVSKLYTYSCLGTGGHTKYARIWNSSLEAIATWDGYIGNWRRICFNKTFTLVANETYNYTIRTGSYPQIHHTFALPTKNGWINCTEFTDVNGKIYDDCIPAIKFFQLNV